LSRLAGDSSDICGPASGLAVRLICHSAPKLTAGA
jgi:hypothetical protein